MDKSAFVRFLKNNYTPCQTVEIASQLLERAGYRELFATEPWSPIDAPYYLRAPGSTAIVAIRPGTKPPEDSGFRLLCAHTDSPMLKLRTESLKESETGMVCSVEAYGSPVLSTWFDRDLVLAGAVTLENEKGWKTIPIHFNEIPAILPGLPIHLQSKTAPYLPPKSSLSVLLPGMTRKHMEEVFRKKTGLPFSQIAGMDLFACSGEDPQFYETPNPMVSSARLDNLGMCQAELQALTEAAPSESWIITALFDSEEIGSISPRGADSLLLPGILERILLSRGQSREDYFRALSRSLLFSGDGTHAYNPLFAERYAPQLTPVPGKGPVIKHNANRRYISEGRTIALFKQIARENHIPLQTFMTRSDLPCGSTIGPGLSASLGIPGIDMGCALWSMHSIRETQSLTDQQQMVGLIRAFIEYSCP